MLNACCARKFGTSLVCRNRIRSTVPFPIRPDDQHLPSEFENREKILYEISKTKQTLQRNFSKHNLFESNQLQQLYQQLEKLQHQIQSKQRKKSLLRRNQLKKQNKIRLFLKKKNQAGARELGYRAQEQSKNRFIKGTLIVGENLPRGQKQFSTDTKGFLSFLSQKQEYDQQLECLNLQIRELKEQNDKLVQELRQNINEQQHEQFRHQMEQSDVQKAKRLLEAKVEQQDKKLQTDYTCHNCAATVQRLKTSLKDREQEAVSLWNQLLKMQNQVTQLKRG